MDEPDQSLIPRPMRHKRDNPRPFWQRALFGFIEALQIFGIAGGAAASKPAARVAPLSQRVRMREAASASSGVRTTSPFVRVEERAIPPAPEPGIAQEKESGSVRYAVKRGDSLWKIAEAEYGSGLRWTDIWNANRENIHEPNLIYPGQNISVPVEETRGILIERSANHRAQTNAAPLSPAFRSLRGRIAQQSEALASSLDTVKTEVTSSESGEKNAAQETVKKELDALIRKAHALASASSTAETRTALFDTVADILQVERDALKIANNLNQGASPASPAAVAPAFAVLNDFALSYVAGESVRANPLQSPHQTAKEITAAAIRMIATPSAVTGSVKVSHDPALAERASELAVTSLGQAQKHLAAGEIRKAINSSTEAVVAAIAANVSGPSSPAAAKATATAAEAVEVVKGADPSSLASAVKSFTLRPEGDGAAGFQGAPPGASLTESNPVLAAEIANAINSPFGIVARVLSPAFLSVPLTIVAGEIRQSLTAQGLNPATGLPSPAADAGQGMTGENADPTGKSVTGTAQGEAGNIGTASANAPAASAIGISDSAAFALGVGLQMANNLNNPTSSTPLGMEISTNTNPDGSLTHVVTDLNGQSATITIASDNTVTAVSSDNTTSFTISPNGTVTTSVTGFNAAGAVTSFNQQTTTIGEIASQAPQSGGKTQTDTGRTIASVSAVSSPNLDQMGFSATPESMVENAGHIASDVLATAGLFGIGSTPAVLSTVTGPGATSQTANAAIAAAAKGDITAAAGLAVATAVTAMAISHANPGSPQSQAATGDMQAAFAALQGLDQAKINLAISDQITGVIFAANKNIPGLTAKGDISGLGEIAVVADFAANITGKIADSTMDPQAIGNHNFVATVNDAVQSSLQALEAANTPQAVAAGQIAGLGVVSDEAAEGKITEVAPLQPVNIFGRKGIDLASLTQSMTGTAPKTNPALVLVDLVVAQPKNEPINSVQSAALAAGASPVVAEGINTAAAGLKAADFAFSTASKNLTALYDARTSVFNM